MSQPHSPSPVIYRATSIKLATGLLCTALVMVLTLVGLAKLHHFGAVPLPFVATMTIFVTVATGCMSYAVLGSSEQEVTLRALVVSVLLCAIVLLSVTGFLARTSLGINHAALRGSLLLATFSFAGFFAIVHFVAASRPRRWLNRNRTLGLLWAAVIALAISAAPHHGAVLPDGASQAESPRPLLAILVLGLLVAALVRPTPRPPSEVKGHRRPNRLLGKCPHWFSTLSELLRRAWRPGPDLPARRATLPAFAALMFFAFTRDLPIAVALLVGGIVVLSRASENPFQAGETTPGKTTPGVARQRAGNWLTSVTVAVAVAVVVFAVFGLLVMLIGWVARVPGISPLDALGYSQPRPPALLYGMGMAIGPGWYQRNAGPGGANADILAVIGRETGVLGLLLTAIVTVALFGTLILLARKIPRRTAPESLAWGLIALLATQCVLAWMTLVRPTGLPFGEGEPLLAGSWVGYPAALLSIAIVVGLSWRSQDRPTLTESDCANPPTRGPTAPL